MVCQHCGSLIPDDAKFCVNCGAPQEAEPDVGAEEFASSQGGVTPPPGWGAPQAGASYSASPVFIQPGDADQRALANLPEYRNKWVTAALCFFLGGLGVHKFYEGKIGMGILYLFTLGLFGIGSLVDLIKTLLRPDTYYLP